MKVEASGAQLRKILEQGVSKYPVLGGRFPQVSNIEFEFDADKAPFERVTPGSINIAGEPLQEERLYSIVSTQFITMGKDGYVTFEETKPLMTEDEAPVFNDLMHGILTTAQKEIYVEEFKLYKERGNEISKKFIRRNIQEKVKVQLSAMDFVSACGISNPDNSEGEDLTENPQIGDTTEAKKSIVTAKRDTSKTVIDCLSESNFGQVLKGEAKLSISCLIR